VKLKPPGKSQSRSVRRKAERDLAKARRPRKASPKRSRAVKVALKREPKQSASSKALSKQARTAASRRTRTQRSAAAKKKLREGKQIPTDVMKRPFKNGIECRTTRKKCGQSLIPSC